MPVTIREVADAAGVSVATASRALSGRRRVSPAAEAAVLAASERLGYRANTVARSLRMRSTATVGMVVPRISNPYFPLLVEVVERQLSATGRELLLCDSQNDVAIEAARVDALLDRQVDGLLFIACDGAASLATLARASARVPVIQMDRYVDGHDGDFVGVDNETGMRDVIAHLVATGARTFALVSSRTVDSSARTRLHTYREAVGHIDPAGAERVLLGDYDVSWGLEAARRLLADGPLPDAIVCGADIIALGVVAALGEVGIRVPGDVAVTGFDDIGFAAISAPPLTTLRQPADAIAAEGVRMLTERLAGADGLFHRRTFRPQLVVRASTRPVPEPEPGALDGSPPVARA
jgi:LacI family transcriptional regulator